VNPETDATPLLGDSPCSEFLAWSAKAGYATCTSDIQLALWEAWQAGQKHARDTNGDDAKVAPWLLSYYTDWYGDRADWKKHTEDSFYADIGTLILFCQDYHFPNTKEHESPPKKTNL
jgi:hypothetical protein